MAVSSAAEVEFLRDQVQRLEATLAHYQQRYKPIKVADERLPTSDAPWAKHEVLSPLLLEYDDSINECMESNERLRSEFSTMKREMGRVVKENDTLRREVKDEMQKVLEAERSDSEGNEADVKELKLQLQAALKEKERASELCQSAVTDVEKLELEMEKMRANPQWRQTSEVKNQYQRAVDEMSKEVSQLQDELRRTYAEKRTAEVQVGDLRQTLEELRQQLMLQQKAHHDAVGEGVLYQEENELVKRQVNDKESKLSIVETDLEKFKRESKALNETCKELQAKCVDLEQKEYEASLQVRDSVQLVENAVLERDQVRIHEQQLLDENRKLQDAFNKLLDEAGSRTREEVENVKQLFNTNLERLTEELYHVEMESAEKTSQMERLVRDKKQLESELEKCYKDGLTQGTNDQNNLTELTKRACVAEAERDDAVIKHDNLQNQMKRFEMGRAQEKHQFVTKCKQLKERLEKSDTELETINKERLQTQDELDNVRRQLINLQKEKDSAERKFSRELACLEQEHKMKERESEVRLQTLEDSQRQSLVEVRRHLNAQQKAASKWKVECESITHQFEKKVAELRAEGNRMKLKNLELIHLLAESQKKTAEAKQMVTEYTRSVKRMEDKVREAEQKARLENAKIIRPVHHDRRRPYSPTDSDSQGIGSPIHIYSADDILNGGSR